MHELHRTEVTNPLNRSICAYKLVEYGYERDDLMICLFVSFIYSITIFPKGEKFLETIKTSVQQKIHRKFLQCL